MELRLVKDQDLERLVSLEKVSPPEDADPRKAQFYNQIDFLPMSYGIVQVLHGWTSGKNTSKITPDGLQYSRFCKLLQGHLEIALATMHFMHYPARMVQVYFAGDLLYYLDPSSGELMECPAVVAVAPFSGYGYVEALPNMKQA